MFLEGAEGEGAGLGLADRAVELRCGYKHTALITEAADTGRRAVFTTGLGSFVFEPVPGFSGAAAAAAGGLDAGVDQPTVLATGKAHTAVLTVTGELFTVGHH